MCVQHSSLSHQPGVSAHPVPLGDLVGLHEVPVVGEGHVVEGKLATAADLRENVSVGLGHGSVPDGLDASGVVCVRGPFEIAETDSMDKARGG